MKKVLDFFKGKKTYIVAAVMIILGLLNGDNSMILEALALAGLRNGIN